MLTHCDWFPFAKSKTKVSYVRSHPISRPIKLTYVLGVIKWRQFLELKRIHYLIADYLKRRKRFCKHVLETEKNNFSSFLNKAYRISRLELLLQYSLVLVLSEKYLVRKTLQNKHRETLRLNKWGISKYIERN